MLIFRCHAISFAWWDLGSWGLKIPMVFFESIITSPKFSCRVLKGGCPRGGGNWGTLRIPFGKIGEP